MTNLLNVPARDREGNLNIVVETPRGSRAKLKYEALHGTFNYGRPLVLGVAYPYDWGFVPARGSNDRIVAVPARDPRLEDA